jgi:hypothetical protein
MDDVRIAPYRRLMTDKALGTILSRQDQAFPSSQSSTRQPEEPGGLGRGERQEVLDPKDPGPLLRGVVRALSLWNAVQTATKNLCRLVVEPRHGFVLLGRAIGFLKRVLGRPEFSQVLAVDESEEFGGLAYGAESYGRESQPAEGVGEDPVTEERGGGVHEAPGKAGMIAAEPRFRHAQFPLEGRENQELKAAFPGSIEVRGCFSSECAKEGLEAPVVPSGSKRSQSTRIRLRLEPL